ncbi:MAG: hypothetical protein PVF46_08580 [Lysobacterales bacterium]|jgi:hypothetical protein
MTRRFYATFMALMLSSMPAVAQDNNAPEPPRADEVDLFDQDVEATEDGWKRMYIALGVMYVDADGHYKVRQPGGDTVTIIDFDRVGLKETDYSHWLTLAWRSAGSRWGAWFGSWRYNASSTRVWEHEFDPGGGQPIPAGVAVNSLFDSKWYVLEAAYSFHRTENLEAGIGFGLHAVDLDTSLITRIEAGSEETELIKERLDTLAPLPNALFYANWKFAPGWYATGRVGYFGLDYDDYDGRMLNAHALLGYQLSPRWSLALGYQLVNIDLEVDKQKYDKIYDLEFSGPLAYLRVNF